MMVDDRKNMARRLQMIKESGFFQSRRKWAVLIGVLCAAVLGGVLLTSALDQDPAANAVSSYDAQALLRYRTHYVGDNSRVVNIIDKLPLSACRREVSLQTGASPYGITVNYDFRQSESTPEEIKGTLRNNAVIMFALINNAEVITFAPQFSGTAEPAKVVYSRSEAQQDFPLQLWEYSKDIDTFKAFLNKFDFKLFTDDLDEAVANAIKSRSGSYMDGEIATEGHTILSVEEEAGTAKVYVIASLGVFGFENGIFTIVSGSGAIPTVITFYRDEKGRYSLVKYQEPLDGAGYAESIKEMFPLNLQGRVLSDHGDYAVLKKQQETQAKQYLQSIGRSAQVSTDHVEKTLADINTEASNKLTAELSKYDPFLNNCPYWLGTREAIENGERFIYEKAQSKTSDGFDLITFRKTTANGDLVEERQYKIVGAEPRLLGK